MLIQRIITSFCALPLLILSVWFDNPVPWFTLVAVILGLMAVYEFYRIVRLRRVSPLSWTGYAFTFIFIIAGNSDALSLIHIEFSNFVALPVLLGLLFIIPAVRLWIRPGKGDFLSRWSWTVSGAIYIGLFLSFYVALRDLPDGRNWVYLTLFTVFGTDTGAFFIGRTFGRHKMAPLISPKKSWEGAVGGLVTAILVAMFFTLDTALFVPIDWWQAALLGTAVSIVGQLGDLAESRFKRQAHTKDSSHLIPGHGGFLDRVDSVVFAGIVVYYYVIWIVL